VTNELETHVKILVRTEPVDGYPPEEWEGLWAVLVKRGYFKIDNIPFYAKNLSCDDIVEARRQGKEYVFERVAFPSENSTIRVVLYDLADESDFRKKLQGLGCRIEGTGTPGLIAVNVPKESLVHVLDTLEEGFAMDKLDFEEGALR